MMENEWLTLSYPTGMSAGDIPECNVAGCHSPRLHRRTRCAEHYAAQQKEYARDRKRKARAAKKEKQNGI